MPSGDSCHNKLLPLSLSPTASSLPLPFMSSLISLALLFLVFPPPPPQLLYFLRSVITIYGNNRIIQPQNGLVGRDLTFTYSFNPPAILSLFYSWYLFMMMPFYHHHNIGSMLNPPSRLSLDLPSQFETFPSFCSHCSSLMWLCCVSPCSPVCWQDKSIDFYFCL